jgi:hypothetical protein
MLLFRRHQRHRGRYRYVLPVDPFATCKSQRYVTNERLLSSRFTNIKAGLPGQPFLLVRMATKKRETSNCEVVRILWEDKNC